MVLIPIDTKVIARDTRKGKERDREKSLSLCNSLSFLSKQITSCVPFFFLFSVFFMTVFSSSLLFLLDSLPLLYVIFLSICVTLLYCLSRSSISFFPSVTAQIIAGGSGRSSLKIRETKSPIVSRTLLCPAVDASSPEVSPSFLSSSLPSVHFQDTFPHLPSKPLIFSTSLCSLSLSSFALLCFKLHFSSLLSQ